MSLISNPLFKTDNVEELAAADAYSISGTRPINKLYEAAKGVGDRLIDRAGGVRNIAQGITSLVQLKSSGATGRQLLESGMAIFGTGTSGILRMASDTILDKAGQFIDLDPTLVTRIKSTAEQVAYQVQYGDPGQLANYGELTALIGSMTGNEELAEYINLGYESAVWGATLTEAVNYGSSYYIGDVKQYIDPAVYRQALIYSIPAVATSGNLQAYNDLKAELDLETILANKPDFVKVFLGQYKLPNPLETSIQECGTVLFAAMTELDARWYLYKRANDDIISLEAMAYASNDARRALEYHPIVGEAMQIAPSFPDTAVWDVIREQYPLMVDIG